MIKNASKKDEILIKEFGRTAKFWNAQASIISFFFTWLESLDYKIEHLLVLMIAGSKIQWPFLGKNFTFRISFLPAPMGMNIILIN